MLDKVLVLTQGESNLVKMDSSCWNIFCFQPIALRNFYYFWVVKRSFELNTKDFLLVVFF
jgi:hypothetical protein